MDVHQFEHAPQYVFNEAQVQEKRHHVQSRQTEDLTVMQFCCEENHFGTESLY